MATGRTNAKGAGGSPSPSPAPYTPPVDWINIDTITNGNINLLVSDSGLATYAFFCTTSAGTYHVDWGDGTSADFASGVTAEHTYTIGTGQACSRGYTTFKIVISPNTGDLSAFRATSHTLSNQMQSHHILACVIAATNLTSLGYAFYKLNLPSVVCPSLEYCNVVGVLPGCSDTNSMFLQCSALQSVDVAGLVGIIDSSAMFKFCYSIKSVDVSSMTEVVYASHMFAECSALEVVDVSSFSKVTDASYLFNNCNSLKSIDVSNMVKIENASYMFFGCTSLVSIKNNGFPLVTNSASMFATCTALQSIDASLITLTTNSSNMFKNCYSIAEFGTISMPLVGDASNMFNSCYSLKSIDVSSMTEVTNASYMFASCRSLQSVDISGFTKVTNASYMFYYNYALELVDLSSLIHVTNASNMFSTCKALKSIDVSDMVAVTDTSYMFAYCLALKSANISTLVLSANAANMFFRCYSLESVIATNFAMSATSVSFLNAFIECELLKDISFPQAKMTALSAVGASGILSKLETITMHPSSLLNGTTTSMDLRYNTLSTSQLSTIFSNLPIVTTKTVNITGSTGATQISLSISTTANSITATAASTAGLELGMEIMGAGTSGSNAWAVTFQDAGNTVTRAGVETAVNTIVYFATISTTTGIVVKTPYYVVNPVGYTFQLSLTQGGAAINLTNNGSGTMNYSTTITGIVPNVSITLSTPASVTSGTTHTFSHLKRSMAIGKGWSVTG